MSKTKVHYQTLTDAEYYLLDNNQAKQLHALNMKQIRSDRRYLRLTIDNDDWFANMPGRPLYDEDDLRDKLNRYTFLTPYERQVWFLLVVGYTMTDVAVMQGVSRQAINYHRNKIIDKLKRHNVVATDTVTAEASDDS